MHSKTHLICFAAGRRSDPLGRELITRETPSLRDRERVLKKVGQKRGMRKNKGKEKSIVVLQKFDSIIAPTLDV